MQNNGDETTSKDEASEDTPREETNNWSVSIFVFAFLVGASIYLFNKERPALENNSTFLQEKSVTDTVLQKDSIDQTLRYMKKRYEQMVGHPNGTNAK